jgi:uncharacterized protein with PQ loop repeat
MFTSAAQLLGTAATAYGVLAALTTLLQARQMLARGTSCEVSGRFFASYAGGYAIWLVYGLSTGNLPLITVDAVGLLCAGLTLAVALSLRGSLLHPATWTSCTDPRPTQGPPPTPAQRAVSAGGGGRHRLSELVTGARRMRAPAAFASDPTTQPAYRAQNRPEQGRPSEDRAWGFTPWGRPGNSPGHDRPSAHYRHWPFRCCSSPVTAPTNVAPLPERWTTNVAVQNWKSRATPRVIEPPTTPRPNRQGVFPTYLQRW